MTLLTYKDADTLARTIYGEARSEPFTGQVAVATVMLNRWRSCKWFSRPTLAETCQVPGAFSAWLDNDPNRPKMLGVGLDDQWFQQAWSAGLTALVGPAPFGADVCHYKVVGTPAVWADGREPVAVIGAHEFYAGVP